MSWRVTSVSRAIQLLGLADHSGDLPAGHAAVIDREDAGDEPKNGDSGRQEGEEFEESHGACPLLGV
jgi:hypothetical protein